MAKNHYTFSIKRNIILGMCYLCLIIPICYSLWYSVPASDDFAYGAKTISDNILVNAFGYAAWSWMHWSGRWLTFFIQKLICPLNLNMHLGHIYGVYMIVLFLLLTMLIIYSLRIIVAFVLRKNTRLSDIVVLVIVALLFTTNYYVEAYNWYVGATAYQLPMALTLLSFALMIKYILYHDKRYLIGATLAGIMPATNEFFDIPIGIMYLYIIFYLDVRKKGQKLTKQETVNRLIPLLVFIVCGASNVFAPGNGSRQSSYASTPSLMQAIPLTLKDIIERLWEILRYHPLALVLFIVLVILGIYSNRDKAPVRFPWIGCLAMTIGIYGSIFPYIYARAFDSTYMDVRMEYVLEYLMLIAGAILCLTLGRTISYRLNWSLSGVAAGIGSGCITLLVLLYMGLYGGASLTSITMVDIYNKHQLIAESYDFWNGILEEIENSTDDDVVIYREQEPEWNAYFLYSGIVNGEKFDVDFNTVYDDEEIMINVYYGKKSITLIYQNE